MTEPTLNSTPNLLPNSMPNLRRPVKPLERAVVVGQRQPLNQRLPARLAEGTAAP